MDKFIVGIALIVLIFGGAFPVSALQSNPKQFQHAAATASPGQSLYNDPFAYCAAVGTVDAPDRRYNGPQMPDSVIQGLIRKGVVSADAPSEFKKNRPLFKAYFFLKKHRFIEKLWL